MNYFGRLFILTLLAPCLIPAQREHFVGIYSIDFNEPSLNSGDRIFNYTAGDPRGLSLSLPMRAVLPADFHARFFHGSKAFILDRAAARRDREGCIEFSFTQVIPVRAAGPRITFQYSPDATWLTQGQPQIYTVVFEASDESGEPGLRLLYEPFTRIYMRYAIQIRVKPGAVTPLPNYQNYGPDPQRSAAGDSPSPIQHPSQFPCWSAQVRPTPAGDLHPKTPFLVSWLVPDQSCAAAGL